jgi:hypothetical protein
MRPCLLEARAALHASPSRGGSFLVRSCRVPLAACLAGHLAGGDAMRRCERGRRRQTACRAVLFADGCSCAAGRRGAHESARRRRTCVLPRLHRTFAALRCEALPLWVLCLPPGAAPSWGSTRRIGPAPNGSFPRSRRCGALRMAQAGSGGTPASAAAGSVQVQSCRRGRATRQAACGRCRSAAACAPLSRVPFRSSSVATRASQHSPRLVLAAASCLRVAARPLLPTTSRSPRSPTPAPPTLL